MNITGSRAVITGAGSGIGAATARRFANAGAKVVLVDIDGDAAREQAQRTQATAVAYQADVSDRDAVAALAGRIEDEQGPVDILVNNAGVGIAGPFLDNGLEDWDWLRGVNLDGVVYCTHAFGKGMVARRHGHVVNIASMAGYVPNRNMAAYSAAKAAVVMFSRCVRADWSGRGVGVSVICPGFIDTPIASRTRMFGPMVAKRQRAIRAFSRFGHSPDLVAKAITKAVEKDRELVPVGIESHAANGLMRVAPGPLRGFIARQGLI